MPVKSAEDALRGRLLLTELLPQWQSLLQGWSASGQLTAAAQEALQLQGDPRALRRLVARWASGDFRSLPANEMWS